MSRMRSEMEVFQDLERIRREFDATQSKLQEQKQGYVKRRDTMRQQVRSRIVRSSGVSVSVCV